MKIKALLPIIIIGFVVAFTYHFIAIAAIDAPHNESNNVNCGSCHGEGLLQSFWGGSGLYSTVDQLCLSCHKRPFCPYTDDDAPQAKTHLDSDENPLAECRTCHNPHYQIQKLYKFTDPGELYLAWGTFECPDPVETNCPYDSENNTTTLKYTELNYKSESGWDATKLRGKTNPCRRTILFPDMTRLGYSYLVESVDEVLQTITVKGDARPVYGYLQSWNIDSSSFVVIYGQFIRKEINGNPVKFFDQTGTNSFADGEGALDGVCEVCHTPQDAPHFAGARCTDCHTHSEGLSKPTNDCIGCHSYSFGGRAKITQQFEANSHHVQGVALDNTHCYECHWEAQSDGTINNPYHEGYNSETGDFMSGEKVDLVIYGAGERPTTYTEGTTALHYMANGSRVEIGKLNAHCLSCHSNQNNDTDPFLDGKTPKEYAWDGTSIDDKYSQTDTTTWGKYGGIFINESFDTNPGYDETWTQTVDTNCSLSPPVSSICPDRTIAFPPPPGIDLLGSQCLRSISVSPEYAAYATRDYGSMKAKTFTTFYLYVQGEGLANNQSKVICALQDNSSDPVFVFRLNKDNSGQLQFMFQLYNDGALGGPSGEYNFYINISTYTWYKIAVKYDYTDDTWGCGVIGPGAFEYYKILANYSGSLIGTHRNGIRYWNFGFMRPGADIITGTVYFDSIIVSNDFWGGENVTPKNTQTKAYSAHGNATSNQGGRDLNETWPNTRNGLVDIACFDCHNSHGSSVDGVTASYQSQVGYPMTNGGILKDTEAGKGGYLMGYKPQSGGSTDDKNVYNAGAGLCFDCHMNALADSTPWGYNDTFGATQAIMGYWDTPYFGPGATSPRQRFGYKIKPHSGGHLGASSDLDPLNPPSADIGGLCTPCHDPHGVSPTLGTNMQYGVPLLKGTWLTSPYKEDRAPVNNVEGTIRTDRGKEGIHYHIDENTFGSDIIELVTGIKEPDSKFAGLCLDCHPQNSLTDGVTHTWKSKDRIHEAVKGWKTTPDHVVMHNYPCSKCHTPHNSRLPRLMVTNCLDYKHKGYKGNNQSPIISESGTSICCNGCNPTCEGKSLELGFCPSTKECGMNWRAGEGDGNIPGNGYGGVYNPCCNTQYSHNVYCHDNETLDYTDQRWNEKTIWSGDDTPIISGPFASLYAEGTNIKATITWTTSDQRTSDVDYGLTDSYGSTKGDATKVFNHSITLENLTYYSLYHYRVRSTDGGNEVVSGDYTFFVIVPPSAPTLIDEQDVFGTVPLDVMLEWNTVTSPDGDPIDYYVEVDDDSDFSSLYDESGWISGTSWTVTADTAKTFYWRVKARDTVHTPAESLYSITDSFKIWTPIINESFERNPGYDEEGLWTETGNPDEDSALPSPLTGAGSQCLQSISADPGYAAYATRDYGSMQAKTFTTFYIYVESEELNNDQNKIIGVLQDDLGNSVFIFRLNQDSDTLRFNLRIYNNYGNYEDYYADILEDTWYRIDIKYNNIANTWQWKLDGVVQDSDSLKGADGTDHCNGIQKWIFGFAVPTQTITGTVYFDLIKVYE